jgi:PadR family transcriptional regulator
MTKNARTANDFLPLPPADLQLLLALAAGPLHGYGLVKTVEEQSDGTVRIELGSLYRMLSRLERDGLIGEATVRGDAPTPGRDRRFYRLTALGRAVVAVEVQRLRGVIELAGGGLRPGEAR